MAQDLEKTTEGLRAGSGAYIVNTKHIIINKPAKDCVADIQEVSAAGGQTLSGRNIALYGMAAVEDDEKDPDRQHFAPNATLINKGIIEIYLNEMVKAYKDQIKEGKDDNVRPYNFIRVYAMVAGKKSMIVNEGIIRVHFDQEDEDTPVYGLSVASGEGATVINNGTIELDGKGSFATQARVMAIPADNVAIINNGKISVNIEETSTVRVLATTGKGGSIANYGEINVTSSGRLMTIARLADTHILNAGKVNIDFKAHFVTQKVSFLFQSDPLACAIYEHCLPNEKPVPPIVNTGEINVKLEGNEHSTENAVAFGIYSEIVGEEKQVHRFENTGTINVSSTGPYDLITAELGCNIQSSKDFPYDIKIGEWNTTARDFAATKDVILCRSGRVDLSDAAFTIKGGSGTYKAEDLIAQTNGGKEAGDTFVITGSEKMTIENK
ncbi:MAG: hypothetical protein K6F34_11010 [Lachnospiraceae bacterium]|nr:hypothetical protein [Lachnospiraceae bacterium]